MPTPEQTHAAAGKFAQLLSETLVTAAPHLSRIDHEEGYRQLEAFLEDLEAHTSTNITPFLQKLLDSTQLPEQFRPIVEEALTTPAQFSAIVTQLFLYGIVSQLLSTSVEPFLQGVSNDLWTQAVSDGISVPVSPAVIATAAARGLNLGDAPTVTMPAWAYTEAAKSGVDADNINLQASIVGTPPAPQELFELERRGIITQDQVKTGLAEGDTRDDWIDTLVQLAHGWLTPLDFVRAAVQEQMTYADAEQWAQATGLDTTTAVPVDTGDTEATPDMFGLAYSIAGRPPGPQELARMALRGIIDWTGTGAGATTFQQGIAESDVKTKWTDALQQLSQYVPPPEQVTTLLERGAITTEQAVSLWEQDGVPSALAQGYAYIANQQHIGQDKLLAVGEVKTGYYDGIFTNAQATELLGDLGYRDDVASQILSLIDFRREIQAINSIVRKIGTMYENFRISATDAETALQNVGVSATQAQQLLGIWEALRIAPVRVPSAAQIAKAVEYGTLTQEQALQELADLGYQDRDAAIVLSAEGEVKVTPLPGPGTTTTT